MQPQAPTNPYISKSFQINLLKRISNAVSMLLPIAVGGFILIFYKSTWIPSILSVALTIVFFVVSSLGLAIGYHRYFAHHAFKTSAFGVAFLGVMGTWALQGSIISWVSDHRRHHRFADGQFDPHSPYADDNGVIKSRIKGWWHAHIGWMLTGAESDERRYATDCLRDPIVMFISRNYWLIALFGLFAPGALGWALVDAEEAFSCILWAGCFRTLLIHQLAWSANSFGHMHGTKLDSSSDESRNNVFLGVVLMGEGWHSFHHQYPTLAMNEPSHFDGGGHILLFFDRLGFVWDLRRAKNLHGPSSKAQKPAQIEAAVTI